MGTNCIPSYILANHLTAGHMLGYQDEMICAFRVCLVPRVVRMQRLSTPLYDIFIPLYDVFALNKCT